MSLSERIRPGVEAAPWVVDEVRALEAERDQLLAYNQTRTDELAASVRQAAEFAKQRDALLAALRWLQDRALSQWVGSPGMHAEASTCLPRIREAIAACEQPAAPVAAPEPTAYGYSTDGECFHGQFASPEEAAVGCLQYDSALESVNVGRYVAVTAHEFVHAGGIADMVREQAGEEVGDAADGWLRDFWHDKDVCARLRKVVGDFLQAEEPPKFWRVVDVRTITRDELVASGHLDADDA